MSDDLLEFIDIITAWHTKKVANLCNVQEGAKEGTLLKIGDSAGREMTGRDAAFFKLGIEAALVELGVLPFFVTHDEDGDDCGSEDGDAV